MKAYINLRKAYNNNKGATGVLKASMHRKEVEIKEEDFDDSYMSKKKPSGLTYRQYMQYFDYTIDEVSQLDLFDVDFDKFSKRINFPDRKLLPKEFDYVYLLEFADYRTTVVTRRILQVFKSKDAAEKKAKELESLEKPELIKNKQVMYLINAMKLY